MPKFLVEIGIRPWLADAGRVLEIYEIEAGCDYNARAIAVRKFTEDYPEFRGNDSWGCMDCIEVN